LQLYSAFEQYATVKEVRIVKDRLTHVSCGFGFIEFQDVGASTKVLSLMFSNPPVEFKVDGRVIALSYANTASFTPVYSPSPWVSTTTTDSNGSTVYLSYWDQHTYATAYPTPHLTTTAKAASHPTCHVASIPTVTQEPVVHANSVIKQASPIEAEVDMEDELAAFFADVAEAEAEFKESKQVDVADVQAQPAATAAQSAAPYVHPCKCLR
jgi:RNA recognition motif-containing protein